MFEGCHIHICYIVLVNSPFIPPHCSCSCAFYATSTCSNSQQVLGDLGKAHGLCTFTILQPSILCLQQVVLLRTLQSGFIVRSCCGGSGRRLVVEKAISGEVNELVN